MGILQRLFGNKKEPRSSQSSESSLNRPRMHDDVSVRAAGGAAHSVSRSPLLDFDSAAHVRKQERGRGLPYGAAGIESYNRLAAALKSVPAIDAGDPRLPAKRKQCSFTQMIDEVDFFLGQTVAGGSAVTPTIRDGVFVSTNNLAPGVGHEMAKVNDDSYLVWSAPHDSSPPSSVRAEEPRAAVADTPTIRRPAPSMTTTHPREAARFLLQEVLPALPELTDEQIRERHRDWSGGDGLIFRYGSVELLEPLVLAHFQALTRKARFEDIRIATEERWHCAFVKTFYSGMVNFLLVWKAADGVAVAATSEFPSR